MGPIASSQRHRSSSERIGTPAPSYGLPALAAVAFVLALWVFFPIDWIREHWLRQWKVSGTTEQEASDLFDEPMRIIHITDTSRSEGELLRVLRGLRAESDVTEEAETTVEEPLSSERSPDFSYDPFSSGISSSDLLLEKPDPELLRRAHLLRSLALSGSMNESLIDSTSRAWLAMQFSDMQHDILAENFESWSAEARALWMERHEIWKKFFADDDEWP